MFGRFFRWLGLFEEYGSVAEFVGRLLSLTLVGGGGTVTGYLAKSAPIFKALGSFAWPLIGISAGLLIAFILLLLQLANRQSKYANYIQSMALREGAINPLKDSFSDQIIPVEQLRLPGQQLHDQKHFRRCKFVGPGALVLLGGAIQHCDFFESGTLIPLPDRTTITGIVVLRQCTITECEFHQVTIIAPPVVIEKLSRKN